MRLVFRHEDWLVGDDFYYLKCWAKLTQPVLPQSADFQSIARYSLADSGGQSGHGPIMVLGRGLTFTPSFQAA